VYEYRARVFDGKRPTRQQAVAANAYSRILGNSYQPCLTTETHNVLQLRPPLYAAPFLAQTYALKKGRYLRRWARRLRSFMFTREDAIILAYGSFGIDWIAGTRGVEYIVTEDMGLVTNYQTRFTEIKDRFDQMVVNLPAPYPQATLPQVITPQTILTEW
jgi:hypothetical protein